MSPRNDKTTIYLSKGVRDELFARKNEPGKSYEDVVVELLEKADE